MLGICALCLNQDTLKNSHIIPQFIFDYIKETSATGYLRRSAVVNQRVEDGERQKILCGNCEQRFSNSEKYFAEKMFAPFTKNGLAQSAYDENLKYFAASLVFRVMVTDEEFKVNEPMHKDSFDIALKELRKYLLKEIDAIPFDFHFLPVGADISHISEGMTSKIVWYFTRATDHGVICTDDYAMSYCKLPFFFFFMPFKDKNGLKFMNTKIEDYGMLQLDNSKTYGIPDGLLEYFNNQADTINSANLSEKQRKKIRESVEKNLDRVEKSESRRIALIEGKIRKK